MMFMFQHRMRVLFLIACAVIALLPAAAPKTALAGGDEMGYLWSLDFDFEKDFDGLLTIEVGPWKDGELVEVTDKSTATVKCSPVGSVALDGGDAVFKPGGYIDCAMDLAEIVKHNHGLVVKSVDDYGSILLRTRLNSAANGVAPLFTHKDASYNIDFTLTHMATMNEMLSNGAGLTSAGFLGVMSNSWNTYTFLYQCISHGGPCDAYFTVGTQTIGQATAGVRTQFSTGPMTFRIGSDGVNNFTGRMSHLRIDPGNSAH